MIPCCLVIISVIKLRMESYLKDIDEVFNTLPCSKDCSRSPDCISDQLNDLTPVSKLENFPLIEKEDLSNSDLLSLNSPLPTEDLIINEKIDFLLDDTPSISDNYSLTYTKTLNSLQSSNIVGLEVSNLFMNSSPQTHNDSFIVSQYCADALYGKMMRSHTENVAEYVEDLKVNMMETVKCELWGKDFNKNFPRDEIIDNQFHMERDGGKDVFDAEDLSEDIATTGRVFEITTKKESHRCNCEWCLIF